LLYQLLAGRSPDAVAVEPPADGRLRFMRNIPPELCELTARALMRMHPQHIKTPEALHAELKALAEALEPTSPPVIAAESAYLAADIARAKQHAPISSSGLIAPMPSVSPPSIRESTTAEELGLSKAVTGGIAAIQAMTPLSPSVGNIPTQLAAAHQAAYANLPNSNEQLRHINIPVLLLIGFILFALFFGLGWMLAQVIFS